MVYRFKDIKELENLSTRQNLEETIALLKPEYKEYLRKDERFRFGNDGDKKTKLEGVNMFDVEARLAERFAKAYENGDREAIDSIPTYWGDNPGLNAITIPGGLNCSSHNLLEIGYLKKNAYTLNFDLFSDERKRYLDWAPTDMATSYNLGSVIDYFERARPENKTTKLYDGLIKGIMEVNNNLVLFTKEVLDSPDYKKAIEKCEKDRVRFPDKPGGFPNEILFKRAMKAYHDGVFRHRQTALYHARAIKDIYRIASDITTGIST